MTIRMHIYLISSGRIYTLSLVVAFHVSDVHLRFAFHVSGYFIISDILLSKFTITTICQLLMNMMHLYNLLKMSTICLYMFNRDALEILFDVIKINLHKKTRSDLTIHAFVALF